MTRHMLKLSLSALLGIGSALAALPASADEVVTVNLLPAPSGGQAAMSPRKIELSETKPGSVTKEPIYRNTPRYGVITLGDAKDNKIAVVLDAPTSGRGAVRLFVDSNVNGDLTDQPALTMAEAPTSATTKTAGTEIGNGRFVARTLAMARYNVAGRGGTLESGLMFTYWGGDLTVNREYSRAGTLKIGEKTYKFALADQGVSGTFDDFKHGEDDPAKVTVLVDKNGDGVFNMKKEAFDAVKSFRIGGSVFEVAAIDSRGTKVSLRRTSKAGSIVSAKDLKVGGKAIDFETDRFDGKPVMFPDDYKGKIVLLDFWAVWCPPCREEVPNIVRTYEQYHKEGFEILGVSLDRKGDDAKLKDFMKEFGMTWEQIFDGGYWKAEIAQLYGVNSIPHAVLVDGTTGTVLAMGDELRGNGLQAAVEAALSKKR